jgi:glycogen synthase
MEMESPTVRSLLLVRNAVDHDARVLRAARVAERTLDGTALILGVATVTAPAGATLVEGVPVIRLPSRLSRLTYLAGKRVRRILSGLSFSRQAISVACQTRPALVHANDWNTMWTGLAIKLRYGARLVYDSHELWPDRNGRWEWRPWLLACEALFVRAADEVVTSSPGHADALATRYRIPRPTVVRNIPERPANTARISASVDSPPSPIRVVYIGGLMPGRGLEQMIDALPLLAHVQLRAIGPGAQQYRAGLLARARAAGVENRVELRAPVAPGEVQSVLAGAAAGLCLIQPICRSYELSLPNKLFEYTAAGVPVLASNAPVIAAVVRGEGLGEVVPAGGPRALAASLERLLAPDGWRLAAKQAMAFADAHDWLGEASTLADVYTHAGRTITP